jgi:hypothetical protein
MFFVLCGVQCAFSRFSPASNFLKENSVFSFLHNTVRRHVCLWMKMQDEALYAVRTGVRKIETVLKTQNVGATRKFSRS